MKKAKIKDDVLFKRIYGGESQNSKRILRFLLETFLDMQIHSIDPMNTTVSTGRKEKQMIPDVLLTVNGIGFIDIEMQDAKRHDDKARFVSYESNLLMNRANRGQAYDVGKNIVLVFSSYHNRDDGVMNEDDIYHRYSDGYKYSDKALIKLVELCNLEELAKKPVEEMTRKERYKVFMQYVGVLEYKSLIKELASVEEGIRMTYDEIKKYTDEDNIPGLMMGWWREKQYLIEKNAAEEKERKYQEAIQMAMEEKLERKKTILETDIKIKKMEKVIDLVAQGMSKEDAFKKVEDMKLYDNEVLQAS